MLRFAFNVDRDFVVPAYFRFLYVYGGFILIVHAAVFYLLIAHTKNWARAVRVGYLLNQTQMLAHDVWVCFLFRCYTLQPYPMLFFHTPFMSMIGGPMAYVIENVFMSHAVCILLFMLLMMHQQIMPPTSRLVFPRWFRIFLMCFIYAFLLLNPISAYFTVSEPSNKEEIVQRAELLWTREYTTAVLILSDLGQCGTYSYSVYVVFASIALIAPIRILLVGSSVRFLKKQVVITSKTMRMKHLIIEVLIKQTAYVSIFYIYPVLCFGMTCVFQLTFLPDFALVIVRIAFVVLYMLNSSAQFVIMLRTNLIFQKVLKDLAGMIFRRIKPERVQQSTHSRSVIVPSTARG